MRSSTDLRLVHSNVDGRTKTLRHNYALHCLRFGARLRRQEKFSFFDCDCERQCSQEPNIVLACFWKQVLYLLLFGEKVCSCSFAGHQYCVFACLRDTSNVLACLWDTSIIVLALVCGTQVQELLYGTKESYQVNLLYDLIL